MIDQSATLSETICEIYIAILHWLSAKQFMRSPTPLQAQDSRARQLALGRPVRYDAVATRYGGGVSH